MNKVKLIIGLFSLLALFSCKKDEGNLGAYISENSDKMKAGIVDSLEITTYSSIKDSVITSGRTAQNLGYINSSDFGISKCSIFASLVPDSLDRVFPNSNYTINSFYIQLNITDYYGKNIDQNFQVYKLNESVKENLNYYDFDSLAIGEKLGSFTINVSDSGIYNFNLDSSAGRHLFSDASDDYSSKDAFKSFFGGICILPVNTPDLNEGAIYQISKTGISLHLTFSTTNEMDDHYDTEIIYNIENENNVFAKFNHNFDGSEANSILNDSTLGQQEFFTQGLSGTCGKIKFPTTQNWFDDESFNYLITGFEFKVFTEENPVFNLPQQLILTYNNSLGSRSYKSTNLNQDENSYTFQIYNAEINTALENRQFDEMDFEISHPTPGSSPEQAKLFGFNSNKPPELVITYTKY